MFAEMRLINSHNALVLKLLSRVFNVVRRPNRFGLQRQLAPRTNDVDPHEPSKDQERPFVFISHTTPDEDYIRRHIAPVLYEKFLDFHLANRGQPSAVSSRYRVKVLRSLSRCRYFMVVVSSGAIQSEWLRFEVDWAATYRKPTTALGPHRGR